MNRLQVLYVQAIGFILGKDVSTSLRTKAGPSTLTWVCLYPAWMVKGQDSSDPSKTSPRKFLPCVMPGMLARGHDRADKLATASSPYTAVTAWDMLRKVI